MEGLWNKLKHRFSQTLSLSTPSGFEEQSIQCQVKYQQVSDADEDATYLNAELFKSRLIDEILDDIGLRLLHWKVFVFTCLLVMTAALGTAILSAILPRLKSDCNISAIMAGVLTLSTSAGKMVGTTFWGWVSDKYGRKRSFIGGATFILVSASASAFSTNYYWLWMGLFFVGFGVTITFQSYVMIVELFPTRYRSMFSVLTAIFWTLGFLLSAVVSMELSVIGYHWALATVCFPSAILLIGSVFLPDTPYYYLAAGDEQKALNILQNMAPEMDFSSTRLRKHGPETQRADFTQLFRSGFWKITICAFIAFLITYLSHYDLIYTASDVAGSQNYTSTTNGLQNEEIESRYMYSIMAWMNLPEFVIIFTAGLICYCFTIKRVLLTVMLLTLVSQVIALFLVNQKISLLMVTMISRSLLSTGTTLLVLFVTLVYPTEIRSIGTGTCVSAGRIGIILGPFIFETCFAKDYLYGIVFNIAIMSVSFMAIVLLPSHSAN